MAFRRQVKNFVKNYSDAEIKVREATSNDPWGPSSSLMLAISDLTFNTISLSEIMNMLWQRLSDHGKNWRHVYKSLTLMDYLIKNGSKKVIQHCREGFCYLHMLKDFQHIDEAGKDQGYYIRKKSKQVITLLMDEQLLCNEREVACRTRRRTSYSMALPKRLPGAGNSSTACASAPTPEIPASEKKHKLLKVTRLHNKKNAPKEGLKQEQCQDIQLPSETPLSTEAPPFKMKVWESAEGHYESDTDSTAPNNNNKEEDLMLFYEEDPKPLLPTIPPSLISLTTWLSEGEAEVSNLCDADAVLTLSEKSPSLQTNVHLDRSAENTVGNTVTENPLQTPQEKQAVEKGFKAPQTLPVPWSSSKEEFVSHELRLSKSDCAFNNQSSVETLYVSPSFNAFNPMQETVSSKDPQKPVQSNILQMDDENLKALPTGVSTNSERTSSFPTFSMSSPDSAPPEKSAGRLPLILAGPSFWTLSHQQSSSASFNRRDKAARLPHPFAPRGPLSSEEEKYDNFSVLESVPDDSESAKKKTHPVPGSTWGAFSTQAVDRVPSVSCSSFPTTEGSPKDPESSSCVQVLLEEVKSAIVLLHEDLRLVVQELSVIRSHLVSVSGHSPHVSKFSQDTEATAGSSDHIPSSQ